MEQTPVVVGIYYQDWEAQMAVDELANQGIEAVINNELMGTIYPIGAMGGIRVLVREQDADKAQFILKKSNL